MSTFSTMVGVVQDLYIEQLRAQIARPLFWDGTYGPPDTRPVYGPDAPSWVADGACGYIDCRCCQSWVDWYDYHDCQY